MIGRQVALLISAGLVLGLSPNAGAQPPAGVDPVDSAWLASQAQLLLSPEAGRRAEVVHALSHLDIDALDAVQARLQQLAAARPAPEDVSLTLGDVQARSPDALLERQRTPLMVAVVEPLLYLRSLETMPAGEGQLALAAFADLDSGAWEPELAKVFARLGVELVPALLQMRNHPSARVRRVALARLSALGMTDPQLVLANTEPHLVARALYAYANPLDFAAMPRIARLVGDDRLQVREAARAAIRRFGKNAIWQLREVYADVSGQPADKLWGHEQTARELYAVLDRPRTEEAQTLFERGRRAQSDGDLRAMQREFDALLARYPTFPERAQLAPGYAALAARLFRSDALEEALAAYRRALRLSPGAVEAKHWQARVAFVSAELSLTRGVVDLTGYARALQLDPSLHAARDAIDRLSGTRAQHARDIRRNWTIVALVLLAAIATYLLWRLRARTNYFEFGSGEEQSPSLKEEPHA